MGGPAGRSSGDPFARFRRWFAEAGRAGVVEPEALALATGRAIG